MAKVDGEAVDSGLGVAHVVGLVDTAAATVVAAAMVVVTVLRL
jgi:hypothetical protein